MGLTKVGDLAVVGVSVPHNILEDRRDANIVAGVLLKAVDLHT